MQNNNTVFSSFFLSIYLYSRYLLSTKLVVFHSKGELGGKNSTIFYAAVAAWLLPLTYLLTKKGRLCTDFETDKIGAGLIYHEKHLLKAAAVFSKQTQT